MCVFFMFFFLFQTPRHAIHVESNGFSFIFSSIKSMLSILLFISKTFLKKNSPVANPLQRTALDDSDKFINTFSVCLSVGS